MIKHVSICLGRTLFVVSSGIIIYAYFSCHPKEVLKKYSYYRSKETTAIAT